MSWALAQNCIREAVRREAHLQSSTPYGPRVSAGESGLRQRLRFQDRTFLEMQRELRAAGVTRADHQQRRHLDAPRIGCEA